MAQKVVEATGRTYTAVVIAPTATADGYKDYDCSDCGDHYSEIITPINFTVTSSNRAKIGYTGLYGEHLTIPAVFQDVGQWYRIVNVETSAFMGCTKLVRVEIPDSVESIGHYAFQGCTKLTSVRTGNGVKSIGDSAFNSCDKLGSVSIGSNVTSIGRYAFAWCEELRKIVIPNSVTSIGREAFYGCTELTSIIFEDASIWYRTNDVSNWSNMTGGTSTSVDDTSNNVTYFKTTYWNYYWYKNNSLNATEVHMAHF